MAYTLEYSSKDSTVVWAQNLLTGLAPDTGITITRNEDDTDEEVGMDGETVVSIHPNESVMVTITFQQESEGYRLLSALREDQRRNRYLVREPMIISINTGEKIVIKRAHIKSIPEKTWSSTATGSNRAFNFYGTFADWESFAASDPSAADVAALFNI